MNHPRLRTIELDAEGGLLLLDPSVEANADAIEEMRRVQALHERHAIVVPRSNRPGIARIPLLGPELPADQAFAVWTSLQSRLLPYQLIPSADAFCMLIRREVLQHFGLFGPEEDEHAYCRRINRYGYSTILANRAFVSAPGGSAATLPEQYLDFDVDPVDYFGSLAMPHRPRILYDLHHLAPRFYGTADFALNLLRDLYLLAGDEIEFYLDIQPATLEFFRPELEGHRIYEAGGESPQFFDLAFKPTQINSWQELDRINRLAPRVAYTILDMIAVRCAYLSTPGKPVLFRAVADLCDQVFTLSHSVSSDFAALTQSDRVLEVIHLGSHFGVSSQEYFPGSYILLMGNSYAHKGLSEALAVLAGQEEWPVVVVGIPASNGAAAANVRYLESGSLSRQAIRELLAGARVVVYPSHYEGFGLPVLDALALAKPVIVLDNEINRELDGLVRSSCLLRIRSVHDLVAAVRQAGDSCSSPAVTPRRWRAASQEYLTKFRELLGSEIACDRLRARWEFLRARRV